MSRSSRKRRSDIFTISGYDKKKIKRELWEESNLCGICGKQLPSFDRSTLDHIIPLSWGGTCDKSNLQLAHLKCNNLKGDKI